MDTDDARNIAWFIRHTINEAAEQFPGAPNKWVKARVESLADDLERDPGFALGHVEYLRRKHEGEVVAHG